MTTPLKLYSTSSCHLCEEAMKILADLAFYDFNWQEIEISDNDLLLTKYGTKIPVLVNCISNQELNWPFSKTEVIQLIAEPDNQKT